MRGAVRLKTGENYFDESGEYLSDADSCGLPHKPLARLDAQVQLELPVNPVHALVVKPEALHVSQVQEAQPKAPVAVIVGQLEQPVGDLLILLIAQPLIAVARLADAKCIARKPDRYAPACYCVSGHLAAGRWPQSFFASASATISALIFSSTYILRSRAFRLKLPHLRHQRHVHAAVLAAPVVERCRADAQLAADLRHGNARLRPLERFHDLAVCELRLLCVELPWLESLLLISLTDGADYPTTCA